MVFTTIQKINNQPHIDVRKTKYDKQERWFSKDRSFDALRSLGTKWNQLEINMTSEEASGKSKTAKLLFIDHKKTLTNWTFLCKNKKQKAIGFFLN